MHSPEYLRGRNDAQRFIESAAQLSSRADLRKILRAERARAVVYGTDDSDYWSGYHDSMSDALADFPEDTRGEGWGDAAALRDAGRR